MELSKSCSVVVGVKAQKHITAYAILSIKVYQVDSKTTWSQPTAVLVLVRGVLTTYRYGVPSLVPGIS